VKFSLHDRRCRVVSQFDCGGYFGTLKIAIRFPPILIVSSRVPTKTFLPFHFTSRQPFPLAVLLVVACGVKCAAGSKMRTILEPIPE
jgi:hypothetical protein